MTEPPWMTRAWADLGVREVPGPASNARITRYFRDVGHAAITDDETAWCAAFIGSTLERSGIASSRSLMARSYLQWGVATEVAERGAITVLSRGHDPSLGHVGLLVAQTQQKVILLGGNQSNAVTVEAFDRDRILGFRLPAGVVAQRSAPALRPAPDTGFDAALGLVLLHEGGWSDDPFDPGGATNKGITLATFANETNVEITASSIAGLKSALRQIPDVLVRSIYRDRYWQPAFASDLPAALALFHFDAAVNQGVGTAARMVQEALGVTIDGAIGPETLAAAQAADQATVLTRYAEIRRRRYRALAHFWRFGRGWLRRVDVTLARALSLIAKPSPARHAPQPAKDQTDMLTDSPLPQVQSTSPTATPAPLPAKWWGESLTIWGAVLTAVTTVAPALFAAAGIDMPADLIRQLGREAIAAVQALAGLIGTVMTIVGRIRAERRLELRSLSLRI